MKCVIQIVPVTLVMGTIFFLSHQSGDNLDLSSFPGVDKLAHMTAYGVLALSVLWFLGKKGLEKPGRTLIVTVLFCFLYGISDEYHQSFIPLRLVSTFDLLADTAGAFCCSLIWFKNKVLQQKLVNYQRMLFEYFSIR